MNFRKRAQRAQKTGTEWRHKAYFFGMDLTTMGGKMAWESGGGLPSTATTKVWRLSAESR
jgi:hypothetical protein